MNRAEGTIEFYRRQFYEDLTEGKTVRYGTLQEWKTSLLQKGYTPGSVNAFLSEANSYLDILSTGNIDLRGR